MTDLKFSLGKDVDRLIENKQYEEAYELLCNKYPKYFVKKLQKFHEYTQDDQYTCPYWVALVISLGIDFIKPRKGRKFSDLEKLYLETINNPESYESYLEDCEYWKDKGEFC